MEKPVMSLGVMSGVNCMRLNEQSNERASAEASVVLPTPGTSSMSTCPRHRSAIIISSTASCLPTMTLPTFLIRSCAKRCVTCISAFSLRFSASFLDARAPIAVPRRPKRTRTQFPVYKFAPGMTSEICSNARECATIFKGRSQLGGIMRKIFTFDAVDSTNAVAKRLGAGGRGRVRRGGGGSRPPGAAASQRSWQSPAGEGLWVSLLLRPQNVPAAQRGRRGVRGGAFHGRGAFRPTARRGSSGPTTW